MEIGERLKRLRMARGLTQEELADRAELSKGFISQMERDLTSPSIATLEDTLTCLGTDLNDFFSTRERPQVVFTEEDYFVKEDDARRHRIEWIVPNAQRNRMEPIRLTLRAGGSTMPDNPHEGEEFGSVIQGSSTIHMGRDLFPVREGETFYLYPDEDHYISSDTGAELLWVSSPPSF